MCFLKCISNSLWGGRFGDRIPMRARFCAPVQNGPGVHPFFCTISTVSLCRGVPLTTYPHLALRLKNVYSYTCPPLWACMACSRLKFTSYFLPSTVTGVAVNVGIFLICWLPLIRAAGHRPEMFVVMCGGLYTQLFR